MFNLKKRLNTIIFIAIVVWVVVIFYFSSQGPASSNIQSNKTLSAVQKFDDIFQLRENGLLGRGEEFFRERVLGGRYSSGNAIIRKGAHFGIYMVLGGLSTIFGYVYSKKYLMGIVVGVTLPVTVAVLDEYNQQFVGRKGLLEDVMLDGLGALAGMLIIIFAIVAINSISALKKSKGDSDGKKIDKK